MVHQTEEAVALLEEEALVLQTGVEAGLEELQGVEVEEVLVAVEGAGHEEGDVVMDR